MPTPILLLKTKSSPNDGYEDFFTANNYTPTFVPVLEHRFQTTNLTHVRNLFTSGAFDTTENDQSKKYGGLIFTSQRAVEGFAQMIEDNQDTTFNTPNLVLYTVGPATARTLTTLRDKHLPSATIHGADTGTGENLAHFMLEHYNTLYSKAEWNQKEKPSLLFLVGETRRDIIPRTLMDPSLGTRRINVEEVVVYETGVMGSFEGDFGDVIRQTQTQTEKEDGEVWVVVFSPTGCEAMLRVLGLGPFAGDGEKEGKEKVFVATIGPTTRDYLKETFGFEAHVCAPVPSPEGVLEGIERFRAGC
ncbi:uncharacterized protein N7515_003185 [Penicillium bovifimosum]|uniref:Tetrapyrrole biosynthesis uroporphyrinogen III synthase domain-containing protein n=1 Tax=Penicillium bovifimosum TaxID=126998 RepID=A0A9W9H459_9EURO|nr:uncharacterized protein N7515_003185 [Penicillium bovifimosum]KAJ5138337.1 hypothetical protein N7515_003185 [Penicillium bovifimosum]